MLALVYESAIHVLLFILYFDHSKVNATYLVKSSFYLHTTYFAILNGLSKEPLNWI